MSAQRSQLTTAHLASALDAWYAATTAGDTAVVTGVLRKLAAMRSYMRGVTLGRSPDASIPASVGMTEESVHAMYRLMAIAKYDERYVIPKAHVEQAHELEEIGCALDYDEGPYYQTARMDRYRATLERMLEQGSAYRCWTSAAELDALRMQQLARKFDAELSFDFGSVVGEVESWRANPISVMQELIEDTHGFATAMLDLQSRLLRA